MADEVDDEFAESSLPDRWKTSLAFTDHMLQSPGPMPTELRTEVGDSFDDGELVELATTPGVAACQVESWHVLLHISFDDGRPG